MKKRKVAIFDIDGTIFRSSLSIELTEALIDAGVMSRRTESVYAQARAQWWNREGSYDDYIHAVIVAFEDRLKGIPLKTFLRVSKKAVEATGKRVYRYTRALIRDLHEKGYFLLAISHSPKAVLDPFCKEWGFDKVYGRMFEADAKGRLTGATEHLDLIRDKAKILKLAVEKYGLSLKGSIGVGDSESDIPFLSLVNKPICFNPNSVLLRAAKRRGWKVVVERKDVVYHL